MPDLPYLAMVFAGGVFLCMEATRQFAKRVTADTHGRFEILSDVDLQQLSSYSVYLRGYIFYVAIYLALYALFLSVWTLGDAILGGNALDNQVGAQGDPLAGTGPQPPFFDREGYARPIYVASAFVAFLAVGPAEKMERCLRAFAHRLAGIPHGIFRLISRMNRQDARKLMDGEPTPYVARFDQRLGSDPLVPADHPFVDEVRASLLVVDMLQPSVVGQYRHQYWEEEDVHALVSLIERAQGSIGQLYEKLADTSVNMDEIRRSAGVEMDNARALFAVLFSKKRGKTARGGHRPTNALIEALSTRPNDHTLHAVFGAAIVTCLLALVMGFGLGVLRAAAEASVPVAEVLGGDLATIARNTWIQGLSLGALFALAAGLAATFRRDAVDVGEWPEYGMRTVPFSRLLRASLLPAVLTALGVFALWIAIDMYAVVASGTRISTPLLAGTMRGHLGPAILVFLVGLVVAFATLIVTDLHARMPWAKTVGIAALCAVPLLPVSLLACISFSGGLAEAVTMSCTYTMAAIAFCAMFAALVEWAEPDEG